MKPATRIIVNTAAQYLRALISIIVQLYIVRVVLQTLGESDYGVYNVVAGLIIMLGFITNSLLISTQRFISFYFGKGLIKETRKIFSNSCLIHLVFAALLALILLCVQEPIFQHVLNINPDRVEVAKIVYKIVILAIIFSIFTAPYKALFIARENIVYISIVEIVDALLKLGFALSLSLFAYDNLIVYAWMNAFIYFFSFAAFLIFATLKYNESSLKGFFYNINKQYILKLLGFTGWTTYGAFTVALKTHGLAVVLNHFLGELVNAAYGIAIRIFFAMSNVSSALLNAMNPQIIKAEGADDRKKMLMLATKECKYSSLCIIFFAIPVIVNMDEILKLWLVDVPQYTNIFTRFILIAFIADQLTLGLQTANQAIGKIKTYSLMVYTPKLLLLPFAYYILCNGGDVTMVMWMYLIVEIIVSVSRVPYLKKTAGLTIKYFIKGVIVPVIPIILISLILSIIMLNANFNFLVNIALTFIITSISIWFIALDEMERTFVKGFFKKKNS